MALLDFLRNFEERTGKRIEENIGGLLGEDLSKLSEAERKAIRRQARMRSLEALGGLGSQSQAMAGVAEMVGNRLKAQRQQKRQAEAEQFMGQFFGGMMPQMPPSPAGAEEPAGAGGAIPPAVPGTVPPAAAGAPNAGALALPPVAGAPGAPNVPSIPGPGGAAPTGMDFQSLARIMISTPQGRDFAQMNPEVFKYVMENAKPKEEKMSNDYSDYLRAANKGYTGSFLDYQKELKRAGASNVTVPVDLGQKANVKAQEAIATADATALQELRKSAEASKSVWRGAQKIIDLSSRPGYSGVLAPNLIGANNFLVSIFGKGVAQEALTNAEAFNAAVNNLVFSEMATLGGARGFSREETAMLLDAFPKITSSPQARIAIAKMLQNKAIENMNYYNDSLGNFKSTYTDVRTSMRPIDVPSSSAPPAGTVPAKPLRSK